jgi:hypothetical protein
MHLAKLPTLKGRKHMTVPNKHLSAVLKDVTMAKLDIEGAEYGMEEFFWADYKGAFQLP